jgi:PAS domain S-box-containing protein
VTEEAQALFLNAIPLLALSALYLVATLVLVRGASRKGRPLRGVERSFVLTLPSLSFATGIVGVLLLVERAPLAGNAWAGFVAALAAAVPAVWLLGDNARTRARREPVQRGLADAPDETTTESFTDALTRADDADTVARLVVERATSLLQVEFGAVTLVDGMRAHGIVAALRREDVPWWRELELDLNEPSAIATAAFEGAPFAVFDIESSAAVNREIAATVGAKSGLWVPLVSAGEVIGVLALVTTGERRSFSAEEIGLAEELASEAALALERARSRSALAEALRRERFIARVSQRVRGELDLDAVLATAVEETAAATGVERCFIRLGEPAGEMPVEAEWTAEGLEPVGNRVDRLSVSNLAVRERRTVAAADIERSPQLADHALGGVHALVELGTRAALATPIVLFDQVIGVVSLHRNEPRVWSDEDVALAEGVAQEIGLAIHVARLLAENRRRLEQRSALLDAAQVLTSELEFELVIERLVEQVVELLGADAADCWIYDDQTRLLRCRAVYGLPVEGVGREVRAGGTLAEAVAAGAPLLKRDLANTDEPPPSPAYRVFSEVMEAPIAFAGEIRGVLGVWSKAAGRFQDDDLDVLDIFAGLASLALQNAEAFEERAHQARVQRGFYRIATVLGGPLSLAETLEALAQAASEALGGSLAAVLMPSGDRLEPVAGQSLPEPLHRALEAGLLQDEALLRSAAATRRIIASLDVSADERFGEAWRNAAAEARYRSLLAIPVDRPGDEGAGLVLVFFADARRFSDDDIELAEHLAGAARGALERSSLYEEERRARSLAQQLARTGSLLATELDPAAVLEEVVRHAPQLVGVDACAIRVLEDDELVISAVAGEDGEALVGSRSPGTAWLSGDVVQSRAPLALTDAAADERLLPLDPLLRLGYRAYLGVPLSGPEDSLHGVLAVYSRTPKAWRNEEIEALLALAGNASAALSNAELYQRVAVEKERSLAILANIADGIVAVDRDGRVVAWNHAAEEVTGVPQVEALGRTPYQVLGRDLESDETAPTGDRLVSIVRGGEEVWLSLTEAIMRDPAGAVAGRIYAFRDISADRVVEQMKSDFVSTVSQELRRPLTSIYGFAETLLRRDVLFGEDERRVFLGYIASESERLTTIVDALLNVARLDAGDLQVNLEPTDVGALVSEVVSAVEGSDRLDGHSFVLEVPEEPISAEADRDKLRQVLSNLVDNAIKFSPRGGTVTVAAHRRADSVEVSVADEGVGIPPAEQQRIFRKFYRGDAGATREGGGTGLGLFIAEGLLSAMGGRIWVNSTEGAGARFTFELPVAQGSETAVAQESAVGRGVASGQAP